MSNRSASLAIPQAIWKPCLVNLILKDIHLVFYMYGLAHKIWYLLHIHKGNTFGLGQWCIGSSTVPWDDSLTVAKKGMK